jgi:hypothetical protein
LLCFSSFHHLEYQSNRIESNRGQKRLIVAFTCPISHHILRKSTSSPMIITLACASAKAVLLTHQSYLQQRRRRRRKGTCFGSNFTTNSCGREVESEELTINQTFICNKFM